MESRIGEEMLEENLGDAEEVYKDTRKTPKTCNPMFQYAAGNSSGLSSAIEKEPKHKTRSKTRKKKEV